MPASTHLTRRSALTGSLGAAALGVFAPSAMAAATKTPTPNAAASPARAIGAQRSSAGMMAGLGRVRSLDDNAPANQSAPNTWTSTFTGIDSASPWQDVRALAYLLLANGVRVASWETSWGHATSVAVLTYQRRMRMAGGGRATPATLARLIPTLSVGINSYATFAVQTLLKKHGYLFASGAAPAMTTRLTGATVDLVVAFQTSHGLAGDGMVGPLTWATLFAAPTCGPVYPLQQAGSGNAQWTNCGPTSAVALLISRGKSPARWTGSADPTSAGPAIATFRYNACGVPTSRDGHGTWNTQLETGLAQYGFANCSWQQLGNALAVVRTGSAVILSGNANAMPWPTRTYGPVSHWVALLGWDGRDYLVIDPISTVAGAVLHRITADQLNTYVATDNNVTDATNTYAALVVA